ncbi:MAG: vWA domain-containing protein [Pseudomonadota bacterium]
MTLSQFWTRLRHDGGQFSVLLGLTILPLLAVVGFAIDVSRQVNLGRHVLISADFASLAGSRAFDDARNSDEEISAIAASAYFAQLNTAFNDASCDAPTVTVNRAEYEVSVSGICQIPTLFGARVSSLDAVSVQRRALAKAEMTSLEVALMLDVSSSMNGARLESLKTATTNFVESMVHNSAGQRVKVSLIPYGTVVNAGVYGNRAMGRFDLDDRQGDGVDKVCVRERVGMDQYTDATPDVGSWVEEMIPWNHQITCPASGVVHPLSSNRSELINAIENLDITEEQWTGGHIAIAWSWYTLSPNWQSIWRATASPADYDDADTRKVVVIMTDGEFNEQYEEHMPIGFSIGEAPHICRAMQEAGIDMYSVGFDIEEPEFMDHPQYFRTSHYVMSECASHKENAYFPKTGEDLIGVFDELSIRLKGTRLSG